MNSETTELMASVTSDFLKLPKINHRDLVRQLLSMDYEYFLLRGTCIDQLAEAGVLLHSEDLSLLFEWYESLEKLLVSNESYQHNACLADALLTSEAYSDREVVQFKLEYCPKLDKANLVSFTASLSEAEYVQWWRSIVHQILAVASRAQPAQ